MSKEYISDMVSYDEYWEDVAAARRDGKVEGRVQGFLTGMVIGCLIATVATLFVLANGLACGACT